jgi:hypothetical protein
VPDDPEQANWKQTPFYFVAWLVSIALLLVCLMWVRDIVAQILTLIGLQMALANPEGWPLARLTYGWTSETIDYSVLIILACVGIALTIIIEYYYRKGIPQGLLTKRVIRVTGIELIVGVSGWVISLIFTWLLVRMSN